MQYIYLDTALLGFPNYGDPGLVAEGLLDRLTGLADIVNADTAIKVVIADDAEDLLYESKLGPTQEGIQDFLDFAGLRHVFAWQDLFRAHVGITDRALRASTVCPVDVVRHSGFAIEPGLPVELAPLGLLAETKRILSSVAASDWFDARWHFGSAIDDRYGGTATVKTIVDEYRSACGRVGELPAPLEREIRVVSGASEFVTDGYSKVVWESATSARDIHLAISLGALAIARTVDSTLEYKQLQKFEIGSEFLASLKATQSFQEGRFSNTVRTICCQLIAKACRQNLKPFGLQSQVTRPFDEALAWRVHVTKDKEALRLMYWQKREGIEFANVGPKHELKIAYGERGETSSCELTEVL